MLSNLQSESVATALIHSVVVLNISDQWTRSQVQNGEPQTVCGALLGKQKGRIIEIWNAFELKSMLAGMEERSLVVDEEYFVQRSILYKETFADLDFLGFYVTGEHERTTEEDVSLQRQAWPHNGSPFLLKFNASSPVISDKVAITLFDSALDPSDGNQLIFQPIPLKIVNELAEQIGLDHVARYSKAGETAESSISRQMSTQFGALNKLLQGLAIAHEYANAVKEGRVQRDEAILYEIHKLCLKLSIHSGLSQLESGKGDMVSDHKMLVLLSALCNVQGSMFTLLDKVNTLAREHLHRERSSLIQHHQHLPSSMFGVGRMHPAQGFPRFF